MSSAGLTAVSSCAAAACGSKAWLLGPPFNKGLVLRLLRAVCTMICVLSVEGRSAPLETPWMALKAS